MDAIEKFDNVSDWLELLRRQQEALTRIGWDFVYDLEAGISRFGRKDDGRIRELYALASEATGKSVKTLQNLVSMTRNPVAAIAQEYELDFSYADAVLGVNPEQADYILSQAKAHALPVAVVRNMAHARAIPVAGSATPNVCPTCGRPY